MEFLIKGCRVAQNFINIICSTHVAEEISIAVISLKNVSLNEIFNFYFLSSKWIFWLKDVK